MRCLLHPPFQLRTSPISPLLPSLSFIDCSHQLNHHRLGRRYGVGANPMVWRAPKAKPSIRCMAKERRVKMVAKQIWRELSDMLITDKVLQSAVLPESALGADLYLSSVTTISDVVVSGDLQVAKVYVSVFGDEKGREIAMMGLKSKVKYIRSQLGRRMRLRLTPEIYFFEDESIERGSRVITILDKLKQERESSRDQNKGHSDLSNPSPEDQDWDADDQDEGIIYVD